MMRVERWKQAWWIAGAVGALVGAAPAVAESQGLLDPPHPTATLLRNRAPNGPRLQSIAQAEMRARLPDVSKPTCGLQSQPSTWSYTRCGSVPTFDGEDRLVNTTSDVTARFNLFALQKGGFEILGCLGGGIVTPLGSACNSGARAQAEFRASKVYAEVSGEFSQTAPYDNTDPDEGEYEYFINTSAEASSEWVSEFTSDFTGWLTMQFSVERHGAGRSKDAGGANLQMAVFARPDNLLAPPNRVGNPDFDPQWTFYGSDFAEAGSNPNFWGWTSPYAERFANFGFGVELFTRGLFVEAGRSYTLVSRLTASADGNEFSDFWGTARFDGFEVPKGGNLAFNCGAGVDCGFTVRTASTVVPEPSTHLLLAAGLVGLVAVARRRAPRRARSRAE